MSADRIITIDVTSVLEDIADDFCENAEGLCMIGPRGEGEHGVLKNWADAAWWDRQPLLIEVLSQRFQAQVKIALRDAVDRARAEAA